MKRLLGKLAIAITGWRVVGPKPDSRRFVLIAAPHTSNWDLFYLLMLAWSVDTSVSWMGKHTLFRGPMGSLMRAVGGVAVQRDRRNDLVKQMVDVFASREQLALIVPPEATRQRVEYWKSGFYRIALAAGVPIYFGYLDYPSKTGGFGSFVMPTGDVAADMAVIRAFYADKTGRYPECFGPCRLRDERSSAD